MTACSSSRDDSVARVSVDLDLDAIVFEECTEADADRLASEHEEARAREARRRERRRRQRPPPRPPPSTSESWATLLFAGLCFSEMNCGDVQVESEEDEQLPLF